MQNKLKLSNNIKLVVSDFDGVFTDGTVYIDEDLKHQKKLSFKDIMGVSMLLKAGYKFAIISGEDSNILDYFKIQFSIEDIYKGIRNKGAALTELMEKLKVAECNVVYIGDDINDISAFDLVKYKIAPKNANPYVKMLKNIQITEEYGGNGAFREVVDALLHNTEIPEEGESTSLKYE